MSPKKQDRPQVLSGFTVQMETHCGKLYVTINFGPDGKPFEVFTRFGKAGGCGSAVMDGLSRMISYGLRSGMEPELVAKGIGGIACNHGSKTCMNAVAEAFQLVLKQK